MRFERSVRANGKQQFYCDEHAHIGENFARFAFCKDPELLHAAGKRLLKLKEYL
jgi:kynurenine aminotransferase